MRVRRVGSALAMLSWTCWAAVHYCSVWFGSRRFPVCPPGRSRQAHARLLCGNMRKLIQRMEVFKDDPTSHVLRSDICLVCCGVTSDGLVDTPTDIGPFVAVSASYYYTCAVRSDGQLVCVGLTADDVPTDLGPVVAVSAGRYHTCAVRSDGQLVCFGSTMYGKCDVPRDLGLVVAVSAGSYHNCAVRSNGQLVCFGANEHGQCDVPLRLGSVVAISAGYYHTCAVTSDGQLVCFGWNEDGQCDVQRS